MNPTCHECGGEGFLIVCIDDMCRGAGECMHGDGEEICRVCDGDGYLPGDDEEYPEDDSQ